MSPCMCGDPYCPSCFPGATEPLTIKDCPEFCGECKHFKKNDELFDPEDPRSADLGQCGIDITPEALYIDDCVCQLVEERNEVVAEKDDLIRQLGLIKFEKAELRVELSKARERFKQSERRLHRLIELYFDGKTPDASS